MVSEHRGLDRYGEDLSGREHTADAFRDGACPRWVPGPQPQEPTSMPCACNQGAGFCRSW